MIAVAQGKDEYAEQGWDWIWWDKDTDGGGVTI